MSRLAIALWGTGSYLGVFDPTLLPPPAKVAIALESLLNSADFLADSLDTISRVIAAFVIGAPIALAVGFVMGENIAVGRSLSPIFNLVLVGTAVDLSADLRACYSDWASPKS